jgi:hypothetical protein
VRKILAVTVTSEDAMEGFRFAEAMVVPQIADEAVGPQEIGNLLNLKE